MNFLPNLEYNTDLVIQLKTTSSNVVFPKNVQLAIYACATPFQIYTKAQVEHRKNRN